MTRKSAALVGLAAALSLLPAAGSARKSDPPPPAAAAASAADSGPPVVKLLEAGKGPRRALRFRPSVGLKRTLVMTMRMAMEMAFGAGSMPPSVIPPMQMQMSFQVSDVNQEGDIVADFKVVKAAALEDPKVPAQVMELVKRSLANLQNLSGHSVMTSRGVVKQTSIQVPPTADPQARQFIQGMEQSMKQVVAPLPEEAVGVGAKWETTSTITQNGITVQQTATSELIQLKGDTGKIRVAIAQSAPPQKMNPPGLPAGSTLDLTSLKAQGKALMSLDLVRLLPGTATADVHSEAKMKVGAGNGPAQDMSMKLDMSMEMQSK